MSAAAAAGTEPPTTKPKNRGPAVATSPGSAAWISSRSTCSGAVEAGGSGPPKPARRVAGSTTPATGRSGRVAWKAAAASAAWCSKFGRSLTPEHGTPVGASKVGYSPRPAAGRRSGSPVRSPVADPAPPRSPTCPAGAETTCHGSRGPKPAEPGSRWIHWASNPCRPRPVTESSRYVPGTTDDVAPGGVVVGGLPGSGCHPARVTADRPSAKGIPRIESEIPSPAPQAPGRA